MMATMQLEFAQAMSDFKTMFPDMDRDVIEAVLRANHGAVDATIDQLLAMSCDNQNEKLRNELDLGSKTTDEVATYSLINLTPDLISNTTDFTVDKKVPLIGSLTNSSTFASNSAGTTDSDLLDITPATSHQSQQVINTGASPKQRSTNALPLLATANNGSSLKRSCISRRWSPPLLGPLPPDFLRLQINPNDVLARDFDLPDDEQFAMMLQNEEFMNELRWNQDFMTALEKEQQGKSKQDDDAAFKERLRHMGKMSRKKFLQMARVFTWRNKKVTSAKQIDSLPLEEEEE